MGVAPSGGGHSDAGVGAVAPHRGQVIPAAIRLVRLPQPFQGHQLPLVGDVSVVAEVKRILRIPGEDAALPGGAGHEVVQGVLASGVVLRRLDHLSVHHPVKRAVVITVARVVAFPEPPQGVDYGRPASILTTGVPVDDDHIQVGLLVPAAAGPGAEEDHGLHVGLGCQVPAEVDCGWVGTRVDHRRQLLADAVSPHRRHGAVSGRLGRWRTDCRWMKAAVMGGSPVAGLPGRFGRVKDAR